MSQFLSAIQQFDSISLSQMDEVALLNRFDVKYQLAESKLTEVLQSIKEQYYILEINQTRIHNYNTIYYDTTEDLMYTSHHNGKLNRLKIRKRKYTDSGLSFLEIKRKNNKRKTKKLRMVAENDTELFTSNELDFLKQNTNFDFTLSNSTLPVKNSNSFKRITLVNKNLSERCTIDIKVTSFSKNKKVELNSMAIVEVKQSRLMAKTCLTQKLKAIGAQQQGFSKYCIGRAFLEPDLKQNLFKEKLSALKKEFNGSIRLVPVNNNL